MGYTHGFITNIHENDFVTSSTKCISTAPLSDVKYTYKYHTNAVDYKYFLATVIWRDIS